MCLLGDSIIDFHCSCPEPNESNPRITVPRPPPPTLISEWLTILSTTVVRDIWSADTLKLNFSLYTGLRLRLLTRVFALDKRTPSQYRASFTYGSVDKRIQKLRWLSPAVKCQSSLKSNYECKIFILRVHIVAWFKTSSSDYTRFVCLFVCLPCIIEDDLLFVLTIYCFSCVLTGRSIMWTPKLPPDHILNLASRSGHRLSHRLKSLGMREVNLWL